MSRSWYRSIIPGRKCSSLVSPTAKRVNPHSTSGHTLSRSSDEMGSAEGDCTCIAMLRGGEFEGDGSEKGSGSQHDGGGCSGSGNSESDGSECSDPDSCNPGSSDSCESDISEHVKDSPAKERKSQMKTSKTTRREKTSGASSPKQCPPCAPHPELSSEGESPQYRRHSRRHSGKTEAKTTPRCVGPTAELSSEGESPPFSLHEAKTMPKFVGLESAINKLPEAAGDTPQCIELPGAAGDTPGLPGAAGDTGNKPCDVRLKQEWLGKSPNGKEPEGFRVPAGENRQSDSGQESLVSKMHKDLNMGEPSALCFGQSVWISNVPVAAILVRPPPLPPEPMVGSVLMFVNPFGEEPTRFQVSCRVMSYGVCIMHPMR